MCIMQEIAHLYTKSPDSFKYRVGQYPTSRTEDSEGCQGYPNVHLLVLPSKAAQASRHPPTLTWKPTQVPFQDGYFVGPRLRFCISLGEAGGPKNHGSMASMDLVLWPPGFPDNGA